MIEGITKRLGPLISSAVMGPAIKCGNARCAQHLSTWRSRRGAELRANGDWFCSPECLERRIVRDASEDIGVRTSWARMPLGMILLARGAIAECDLRRGLAEQKLTGERIGECLQRLGLVTATQVTSALATQWQCPAIFRAGELPAEAAAVPLSVLRACRIVPAMAMPSGRLVHAAVDGPMDHGALYAIGRMLDCRVEPCMTTPEILDEMLGLTVDQARQVEVNFGAMAFDTMARVARNYAEELSGGEIRYVSCGSFFWMRIPRQRGLVHLVFSRQNERAQR
jgi:hypothetical protein